jgi:ATP-dependent DNA helicase PIF1
MSNLTLKQQEVFEAITNGESVFISGPAGVGKTEVIKVAIRSLGGYVRVGLTSTTGTSALLIGGTTLHSFLGIGLGRDTPDKLLKNIMQNSRVKNRWLELDILIIDEISMLSAELFDKLEYIARVIRRSKTAFGGIQLILSGDFLQLPCVGSETFCFDAESWNNCVSRVFYLTEIIRQSNVEFQKCLNEVRVGKLSDESIEMLQSRVGLDLSEKYKDIRPTILFPLNANVERINEEELDKIAKQGVEFVEYDMSISTPHHLRNGDMIITRFKKSCPAPESLQLCVGAQVMLVVNLDLANELANGSRGVVVGFRDDKPIVQFSGRQSLIDYYTWEMKEEGQIYLKATQIPLKIAYALSIHKSQGCSLDCVQIDLANIFEYGQAYCGLSRVKNLDGLTITALDVTKIQAHPRALTFYGLNS